MTTGICSVCNQVVEVRNGEWVHRTPPIFGDHTIEFIDTMAFEAKDAS